MKLVQLLRHKSHLQTNERMKSRPRQKHIYTERERIECFHKYDVYKQVEYLPPPDMGYNQTQKHLRSWEKQQAGAED